MRGFLTRMSVLGVLSLAWADEPAGPAKVYLGPEGERITVVQLAPTEKRMTAIRFDGVEGPWNGKTLRHKREITGQDREDYPLDAADRYVSLTFRSGSWEVYPKNAPRSIRLSYSLDESRKADARKIAAEVGDSNAGQ